MSALLEQVRDRRAAARSKSLTEYVALLRRSGEPRNGDAAKLSALAGELGKSQAAIAADVQAVETAVALEERIAKAERQADERAATIKALSDAKDAEHARRTAALAELQKLQMAAQLFLFDASEGVRAAGELNQLRERHPHLFTDS